MPWQLPALIHPFLTPLAYLQAGDVALGLGCQLPLEHEL
jgi:hypothetical protein